MTIDLTYEILAWADRGGRKKDRSTELNRIDCAVLHAAIEGMMEGGQITATRRDLAHSVNYHKYDCPQLTPKGRALYEKRHAAQQQR